MASITRRLLPLTLGLLLLAPLGVGADSGPAPGAPEPAPNDWGKKADPADVKAAYQTGYDQLKAGDYKAAIKAFKRTVKLDDQHAMAFTNMAYSYRQLGKYKKAVKLYRKALAINPQLAEAHEYMGAALVALGQVAEAKRHLAVLEKLDPKLAQSLRDDIARAERS